MDIKSVRELMETLKGTQLTEISIEKDQFKLVLKKPKLVPVLEVEEVGVSVEPSSPEIREIVCQNIGKYYNRDSEGKPLVLPGDVVKEEQIIGYVETVGVRTEIKSTVSGKIVEILLEDGDIADYGKPVVRVEL